MDDSTLADINLFDLINLFAFKLINDDMKLVSMEIFFYLLMSIDSRFFVWKQMIFHD